MRSLHGFLAFADGDLPAIRVASLASATDVSLMVYPF
jgi:hypothetical protein